MIGLRIKNTHFVRQGIIKNKFKLNLNFNNNLKHHQRTLFTKASDYTLVNRIRNSIIGLTTIGATIFFGVYYTYPDTLLHTYIITPILRTFFDPETAHRLAVKFLGTGLGPWDHYELGEKDENSEVAKQLRVEVFGKTLESPVGLAAGFDKNGECIDGLFNLGFSYVEIGSITPISQPGNPKPRLFRLPEDKAIINRYGFNSDGSIQVVARLRTRLFSYFSRHISQPRPENDSLRKNKLLAINLGKNKTSPDEISDYVIGARRLGNYADVLVINVSSPNTPGLRNLQAEEKLVKLLSAVTTERENFKHKPPVLVKIAPDLTESEIKSIANAVKTASPKIDGIIVSNTTIQRPSTLKSSPELVSQTGGLSGKPLKELSLKALRILRKNIGNDFVIIGAGGISSGKDAIEYAKAGATFIQFYSSFAYYGPGSAVKMKREIVKELNGKRWVDIIGQDCK